MNKIIHDWRGWKDFWGNGGIVFAIYAIAIPGVFILFAIAAIRANLP